METGLWLLVGAMALIIMILIGKIHILQKSAKEIETAFSDKLVTETNTLIDISANDKYMRSLASRINEELRRLRDQRRRFQQGDIELKNAVTNISHDLRTPLTAICGYLDLMEREEKSETVARYLEVMKDRTTSMKELTEELFRYSVILAGEKEEDNCLEMLSIGDVLEESIAGFYAVLKDSGIEPGISIPDKKVMRFLDRSSLSRVFSNLINNAVKYSDGDLDIILYETGEVLFRNRASGLTEVQVGKLFDRFYTVDNGRSSTGLGLSIAKTLVQNMGGTIAARYENGRLSISVCLKES